MKTSLFIRKYSSIICILASAVLFFLSLILNTTANDTGKVAGRLERRIEKRLEKLDSYIHETLTEDHTKWMELDLPEDMVVYRYVYDTLQSWCNQFPVSNDNIGSRMVIQRLTGQRSPLVSPLKGITEEVQYLNLGSKWYLAKADYDGINCRVIAGLEIKNYLIENLHKSYNGVNSRLKLPEIYSIVPLDESGGTPVCLDGKPLFKIIQETSLETPMSNAMMRWLALAIIVLAFMMHLAVHRTFRIFAINVTVLFLAAISAYYWGLRTSSMFFSPTVYAEGTFLYSFGALIIIDITVILLTASVYLIRGRFIKWIHNGDMRHRARIYGICLVSLAFGLALYTGISSGTPVSRWSCIYGATYQYTPSLYASHICPCCSASFC